MKAFNMSEAGVGWRDIEVTRTADGACALALHARAAADRRAKRLHPDQRQPEPRRRLRHRRGRRIGAALIRRFTDTDKRDNNELPQRIPTP